MMGGIVSKRCRLSKEAAHFWGTEPTRGARMNIDHARIMLDGTKLNKFNFRIQDFY